MQLQLCCLVLLLAPAFAESEPLTPEDAISTTRILGEKENVLVSPNGKRYAFALLTGDVDRDGNWLTVMIGGLNSLESAKPKVVARLFGRSLGQDNDMLKSYVTAFGRLFWMDDERLLFFWEDGNGLIQLYMASAKSGAATQLTNHPTSLGVLALGVNKRGDLIYSALAGGNEVNLHEEARKRMLGGFTVEHTDGASFLEGLPNGISRQDLLWGYKWFHKRLDQPATEININGREKTRFLPLTGAAISPDGNVAIVSAFPRDISTEWLNYKSTLWVPGVEAALKGNQDDLIARQLRQLYVVDLKNKTSRPLWNAITMAQGTEFAWSPDRNRVLVGPTFLPPDGSDDAGLMGDAIAEVDIRSGKFSPIPLDSESRRAVQQLRWISTSEICIVTRRGTFEFSKNDGYWKSVPAASASLPATARVEIDVRENLNSPTILVAVDTKTGRERTILAPNWDLTTKFKLGHVEKVEWIAEDGKTWNGELYYPADYDAGERYPFVLQTHGGSSSFSLYGQPDYAGLGTGVGVYIAQLLAGRNIGVLQIRDQDHVPRGEYAETYLRGYDAAVRFLIENGLADPNRIGLQGFSRTGWATQYSLVNSSFVYAAAIAADNIEGGYVESVMIPEGHMDAENGGAPYGAEGIKNWLEKAPPFSAERIQTPLLKISQGAGSMSRILSKWELFIRLRRLGKPVELYIMPDAQEHGAHNPQNPRQVAALQHRALDWWLFWLESEEDASPAKAKQYARWRKMREQRDEILKHPRPPKLEWTATPIADGNRKNDDCN